MPLPMRAFQGPLLPAGGRAVVVRAAGRGARAGVTAGVGGRGHAEDMAWVGQLVRDDALVAVYTQVSYLADWSPWLPFETGVAEAPRQPGAYLFREPETQVVRYVGMAGERAGGGRPRGLHGRLSGYCSGHDPVGGFGESALDRALADPGWVERQLARPGADRPRRARRWAADAIAWLAPEVSWAACHERADARQLESEVELLLRPYGLWNR